MITSTHNPRIAAARKLRRTQERRATGLTTVEGPFLLEEALAAGIVISEVFATEDDGAAAALCSDAGLQVTLVSERVLESLAGSVTPRGPISVIAIPDGNELEAKDTLVLWDIGDPGNAGTMVRTAAALGFEVAATHGSVDLWSPKVVRAAVGGHFRTKLITGLRAEPGELAVAGLQPVIGTALATRKAEEALGGNEPVALIIGNEAHGVPDELVNDPVVQPVSLAMPGGTESLNAGVAAGILMYLRMLQRP